MCKFWLRYTHTDDCQRCTSFDTNTFRHIYFLRHNAESQVEITRCLEFVICSQKISRFSSITQPQFGTGFLSHNNNVVNKVTMKGPNVNDTKCRPLLMTFKDYCKGFGSLFIRTQHTNKNIHRHPNLTYRFFSLGQVCRQ